MYLSGGKWFFTALSLDVFSQWHLYFNIWDYFFSLTVGNKEWGRMRQTQHENEGVLIRVRRSLHGDVDEALIMSGWDDYRKGSIWRTLTRQLVCALMAIRTHYSNTKELLAGIWWTDWRKEIKLSRDYKAFKKWQRKPADWKKKQSRFIWRHCLIRDTI